VITGEHMPPTSMLVDGTPAGRQTEQGMVSGREQVIKDGK
jgi:hypothetical protein